MTYIKWAVVREQKPESRPWHELYKNPEIKANEGGDLPQNCPSLRYYYWRSSPITYQVSLLCTMLEVDENPLVGITRMPIPEEDDIHIVKKVTPSSF